jgi:hypothetical protein
LCEMIQYMYTSCIFNILCQGRWRSTNDHKINASELHAVLVYHIRTLRTTEYSVSCGVAVPVLFQAPIKEKQYAVKVEVEF